MRTKEILKKYKAGEISLEELEDILDESLITVDKFGKLDKNRCERAGISEAVFAETKDPEHAARLSVELAKSNGRVLTTRVGEGHLEELKKEASKEGLTVDFNEEGKIAVVKKEDSSVERRGGNVGIITAGTADIPVAEEARVTVEEMGCETVTSYDVGVAGIHRMYEPLKEMLGNIDSLVVIAGMEGALPTVVSSLVDVPVIGVPTSTGYGAGGEGKAALLTMLQTCAPGLTVVNIDNGYAAGSFAALISINMEKARKSGRG